MDTSIFIGLCQGEQRGLRCALFLFFILLLGVFATPLHAKSVLLSADQHPSFGHYASYFVEQGGPLQLNQVIELEEAGRFSGGLPSVPNFGIGSNPVWLHLSVENASAKVDEKYLVAGTTWLDRVDMYVVKDGVLVAQSQMGDKLKGAPGMVPGVGFSYPLNFAQGESDIFLRVSSADPMAVPMVFMEAEQLNERRIEFGYFYGFFYGVIAALCIYNFLLFWGLKERSYLYYSLAIGSLLVCNFSYTGHGVYWLWGDMPIFQQYIILVLMLLYNVFGALFAIRFLSLPHKALRLTNIIRAYIVVFSTIVGGSVLIGAHAFASYAAFASMVIFTFGMFLLGVFSVWKALEYGRYFLLATFFGMLGISLTAFSVWGVIPFNLFTFHAGEIGLMLEATLLSLALAHRIRQTQTAMRRAENAARIDVLTQLNNRRAFIELAAPCINAAERYGRAMSLIILDVDHFKNINDRYGHEAGDRVLIAISKLLYRSCRTSDIAARWGGEEFVVMLPETKMEQAVAFAQRLRHEISIIKLSVGDELVSLTASFGVSEYSDQATLDSMLSVADLQLYKAKDEGRNRVCFEEVLDSPVRG